MGTAAPILADEGENVPLLPGPAWPALLGIGAGVFSVLAATANRYGYHRDEMYFLAAGRHLSWGYPDQPPLVPALARLLDWLAADSLAVLRLPSALAVAAVVVLTGLLARELGGGRGAQALAAGVMAIAPFALGAGHLLSTATFDLLAWTVVLWLFVRLLRTGDDRWWLAIGIVAGIGLLDSDLVAFLVGGLVVGILIAGPRPTLRTPWPWIGGAIALAAWTPYLLWQARHGWPQLEVSRAIAAGESGSSNPRWLFIPYQLGLAATLLAPVWIVGLVRLFRAPALRWCRSIGWAYVFLTVAFIATGGKAYYLAGMFPVLLAAGAQPTIDWMARGRAAVRRGAVVAAFVLSAPGLAIVLPLIPVGSVHDSGIVDANYDAGETIGWPAYVHEIADVYRPGQAILTRNYGEAGAIERFGRTLGLPRPYSGQTGYWYWGPPPADATDVLVVGFSQAHLDQLFAHCELVTRLDNHVGVGNDEQGVPLWSCSQPRASWADLWPSLRTS